MTAQDINNGPIAAQKSLAIIQMTRIGDILQTCHAARLLKLNHPEYKLILIARKQFVEPIKFIVEQVFDEIHSLDLKGAINLNDGVSGSIKNILSLVKEINKNDISASINLSFSKSSNYLHSLLESDHKLGSYYTREHNSIIQDKWSQYLYSTVMRGDLNPFNLVDLFSNIIGVKKVKTHLSNTEYSAQKKNNILIHPFASLEKKMWHTNKWVEVIFKMLKENPTANLYIAGGKQDQASYESILNSPILKSYASRIKPLIGKPLTDLYKLVDETFLFIGHDSMIGNLLSFKNVKTITVTLGTARTQETTPYALGNYVLSPKTNCFPCFPDTKCDYFQCHADIPYQTLISVANQLMASNTIDPERLRSEVTTFNLNSVNIHKTTVNKAGQLLLESIIDENKSAKEIYRDFYNMIWSFTFNEIDINLDTPKFGNQTAKVLAESAKSIETLYELAEFGKKYTRYILEEISNNSPNIQSIKDYSKKVDEIDRLFDVLSGSAPLLSPVIDYGKVAKSNLHGDNIVKLSESAFYVYQEISNCASVLYDFLNSLGLVQQNKNTTNNKPASRKDV